MLSEGSYGSVADGDNFMSIVTRIAVAMYTLFCKVLDEPVAF